MPGVYSSGMKHLSLLALLFLTACPASPEQPPPAMLASMEAVEDADRIEWETYDVDCSEAAMSADGYVVLTAVDSYEDVFTASRRSVDASGRHEVSEAIVRVEPETGEVVTNRCADRPSAVFQIVLGVRRGATP